MQTQTSYINAIVVVLINILNGTVTSGGGPPVGQSYSLSPVPNQIGHQVVGHLQLGWQIWLREIQLEDKLG